MTKSLKQFLIRQKNLLENESKTINLLLKSEYKDEIDFLDDLVDVADIYSHLVILSKYLEYKDAETSPKTNFG